MKDTFKIIKVNNSSSFPLLKAGFLESWYNLSQQLRLRHLFRKVIKKGMEDTSYNLFVKSIRRL